MNLARLRAATDILTAQARAQASRGQGSASGMSAAVQTRLPLGVAAIDQRLDGGLAHGGLHELRCALSRDIAAAAGFALGLAELAARSGRSARQRIVWVCDPAARGEGGGLFPAGLAQYGIAPSRLTMVEPRDLQGALWAADEAAGCADLAALVFQIKGNPARFDITATRRLMLRARESGVLALVLRQSGQEEASAAATRWLVRADISESGDIFERGVGAMRLSLTLERNRTGQTGRWRVAWNHHLRAFDHAAPHQAPSAHSLDRLSASANRQDPAGAMGQVLDHRQGFGRAS